MIYTFNQGTQLKTYDSKTRTKKCSNPLCGKIYSSNVFFCTCFNTNPFKNQNISDLSLSGFLPYLPYSWSRSVTNLDNLLIILKEIKEAETLYSIDKAQIKNHVFQSFLQQGFITIDSNKMSDIKYIRSGPQRRVSEYLLNLQVLHLIDNNYNLTALGNYFLKTKNTMSLFLNFYILNIKNEFLRDSTYSDFNVRHFQFLLKSLESENSFYLEELMFILMAHNEDDYHKVHLEFFKNTTNKKLRVKLIENYFLGKNNKEMSRQKAAIFNILVSANILIFDLKTRLYSLSNESKNILHFISNNAQQVNALIDNIKSNDDNTVNDLLLFFTPTLEKNKPLFNPIIHKSGGLHEKSMLNLFSKSNVNFRKYDKSFTHIVLPANVLSSLSGGTEHNPDHLCTIKSCSILVDSKSSNSIHGEIHKVIAYNIYAKEAHTKAFIFLDDTLPNKSISIFQKLILETHENLENIILFTKSALENLSKNDSVKTHFENLFSANKFTLVCSNLDKNFKLLEQSFPDNLYYNH